MVEHHFLSTIDGSGIPRRILLVEDDEEDYLLTNSMLAEAGGSKYTLVWASSYQSGLDAVLSQPFDAILMDYKLGLKTGLDLTQQITSRGIKCPVILLTGRGNYELDVEAMKAGVTDYLAKSEASPASLERTIRYAILQKQTEEALLKAKEELETRVQERTLELLTKNAALEAEVAERKRVEAELAEVQSRLMDHVEAERREIARDLHDGPMQELYGLIFQTDGLSQEFSSGQGEKAIEAFKEKLLQVIYSLRTISRDLRPPALAPYGLEKAIRSHAEHLQQSHSELKINLHLDRDRQILPEALRMALFRIYQTAITNVIRHAQATEVDVRFKIHHSQVRLEIKDNGCGFELPQRWIELARKGHMGLVGAAERAEAAGGHLEIETKPGKGTLLRVLVPRPSRQEQPAETIQPAAQKASENATD